MLIRCEKCSTTYELEERLIPPGGAPVQCSRCEHVFRAYPPSRQNGEAASPEGVVQQEVPFPEQVPEPPAAPERRGGLELVPPPADEVPYDAAPPQEPTFVTPPPPEPEPEARPQQRPSDPPLAAGTARVGTRTPAPPSPPQHATYKPPAGPVIPPGKPVRKVPNPELEGTDVPSVAPMPRRGMTVDVGTRKRGTSSWIVWGAVALLGFLVVAGTISWWRERSADKAAAEKAAARPAPSRALTRERQEALKLLMRDDAASVERAAAQLDAAVRRDPASAARADRALALALLAQQAKDQAEREDARARSLDEERARAAETPEGAAQVAELTAEADTARAEVEPLRERAGRLLAEARAELDAVPRELASDPAAVRARTFVQLAADEREAAHKTLGAAPADDPWIALATILTAPQSTGSDAGEAELLEQLAGQHPEFVRPRLLAARIRAGLGDGERAIADVDAVLQANPQHLEARRLRAAIAPIPETGDPSSGGGAPAGTGARPGGAPAASPAVNGHSQRGNGAAPEKRR